MAAQVVAKAANPIDLRDPALRCGAKVTLVLTTGETVDGHVHSSDQGLRLILIKIPLVHTTLAHELRVIRADYIESFTMNEEESEDPKKMMKPISIKMFNIKSRKAEEEIGQLMNELNDNASPWGQMIFDALNKTMPCQWDVLDIVVLDQVRIKPEYTGDTCISLDGDQDALARIKKVLAGETKRLLKKKAQQEAAAAAGATDGAAATTSEG
mmetsp:Transcript_32846/g.56218  ORF Transcript_32846/g.56218 Transcript_32846/m.56218 type:complete len:212 (-) Transcript_32846:432-1067(-)